MEAIEQTYNGNTNFGSRVSVLITRNGDLINRVYFNGVIKNTATHGTGNDWATDNKDVGLVSYFGQKLLKNVELEIGGQRIDKHYSEWLYIWNELTMAAGKKSGYDKMVGGDKELRATRLSGGESYELYVPLEFWFCRNVGLALPLIALQYHEVKVNIEFCQVGDLVITPADGLTLWNPHPDQGVSTVTTGQNGVAGDLSLDQAKMWVDYIFLDTDERRRFAQLSHEYLIEQLQFTGSEQITGTSTKGVRMNFNHPCKELIWTVKVATNQWNDFSSDQAGTNPVTSAKIQLNGNDRFAERSGDYFSVVQPYQHHECVPSEAKAGINVYSFALKPEEHQPSGTLNMSRIDTSVLSLSAETGLVSIYAVNYNVLRILSGMGGLAYSN
tara:strand:+ start:48 stop:1202 length:1155 start_codon:yes stop_codon:yes gene_type:complete